MQECRVCHCTDEDACVAENGATCSWWEEDLCDFCAFMLMAMTPGGVPA